MKIKTFEFFVSNYALTADLYGEDDKTTSQGCKRCAHQHTPVTDFASIDYIVNEFIANKMITDIKVNDFTIDRHNNGCSDIIKRTYTIIYND